MREANVGALIRLKNARHLLTLQQYRTLRGQVLAGDAPGAMRGLRKAKRALHFLGFLSYWAIIVGIVWLLSMAVMIAFVSLT